MTCERINEELLDICLSGVSSDDTPDPELMSTILEREDLTEFTELPPIHLPRESTIRETDDTPRRLPKTRFQARRWCEAGVVSSTLCALGGVSAIFLGDYWYQLLLRSQELELPRLLDLLARAW